MPSHVNLTPVQEEPLASQLPRLCSRELLRSSVEPTAAYFDPPPLKWSDLKYVCWHQGGPKCRESIISLKRSSRSYGRLMCWFHRARTLPRRSATSGERGDLLSLAARVRRVEDRPGQAPEGA